MTIFEKSVKGRRGVKIEDFDYTPSQEVPSRLLRKSPIFLPEVSELDVVRHYTNLSRKNFCVDTNFYPLGSCTMKYNPKFCEDIAKLDGFVNLHPLLPQLRGGGILTQGALRVLYEMQEILAKITGMDAFTLQPLAGAHGELTGMMMIASYHKQHNTRKTKVIIPESAHGTNPASARIAGFEVVSVKIDDKGCMDLEEYKKVLDEKTAAVMLTCPNTLGIFHPAIEKICQMAHEKGALMYYDGANLNALFGKTTPGRLGFDVVHVNLHKSFGTPHGSGGPGAGPVGVKKILEPYLPISIVIRREDGTFAVEYSRKYSIGYIAPFYGNFLVILKAYAYILYLGEEGLRKVSEMAVLNANYLKYLLKDFYEIPYSEGCMHEFVISAKEFLSKGINAMDIAKYLIDKGIHPPTVYFPLVVKEALMIEPTETESKQTLDEFINIMKEIHSLIQTNPQVLKSSPHGGRVDEVYAARVLDVCFK